MSRNSQPWQSGHEADRFDRENALPNDDRIYRIQRAKRYPDTPAGELPRETLDLKAAYKRRQRDNSRERKNYRRAQAEERRIIDAKQELERDYYRAHSIGILPSGHRRLEPLAGRLGEAELQHARSREDVVKQHPYHETSLASKRLHHQYVREHYNASEDAYRQQEEHALYMAAVPPTRTRDLYGHEPRRGHEAYHEPYPPKYPPSGHYSTTRGTESSSSGGDWTVVSTSSSGNRKQGRKG